MTRKCEFLIVGSGAGGATLARELSRAGRSVLVLERGRDGVQLGTMGSALACYDRLGPFPLPARSREGVLLWRALTTGGTTVVSCGNAMPCLERELAAQGVSLAADLRETLSELAVQPVPERLLSPASRAMRDVAAGLGYPFGPMPKFVRAEHCARCGRCVLGCPGPAKWTARRFLDDALAHRAEVLSGTTVSRVRVARGRVRGVDARRQHDSIEIDADVVILAAGGLGTPVILQRSGIDGAGTGLFADLFVNVYAVCKGLGQAGEPVMPIVCMSAHEAEGFLLSPFINAPRFARFVEAGLRGALPAASDLVGIMVKTRDDPAGRVDANGRVSKPVTEADRGRLGAGTAVARRILDGIGAKRGSEFVTRVQGAHPGGTAAIGRVVDANLATPVEGLFVCDASVLPEAPGMPPIVTVIALARRLARHLLER